MIDNEFDYFNLKLGHVSNAITFMANTNRQFSENLRCCSILPYQTPLLDRS
jgi:hypothetical protein